MKIESPICGYAFQNKKDSTDAKKKQERVDTFSGSTGVNIEKYQVAWASLVADFVALGEGGGGQGIGGRHNFYQSTSFIQPTGVILFLS